MQVRGMLRPLISTPLLLAALGLALWTQLAVAGRASELQRAPQLSGGAAALGFACAAALFAAGLALTRRTGMLRWPAPDAPIPDRQLGVSVGALCVSVALGAVAYLSMGGNRFTVLNVGVWLGSVVVALYAFSPGRWQTSGTLRRLQTVGAWVAALARRGSPAVAQPRIPLEFVAVAAITLLGAWFLFHRLADVPPELTSDNAEMLLDLQDVLDGQSPIFFPRNTGREPLHFYFNALLAPYIGGVSEGSIKVATAIPAVLAAPVTFLLGRTLFGAPVGLLAGAMIGVSRWHLILGRWGERTSYLAVGAALLAFFLIRGVRDRRRSDFLLAGVTLGVLQHTYLPARIAPVGVIGCVALALAFDLWRRVPRARIERLLTDTGAMLLLAALIFIPLARYGADNPQTFLFRGMSRVTGDTGTAKVDVPRALLGNTWNALASFNWRGDVAWVNNVPGERTVDPYTGALALLGAVYVAYRVVRFREVPLLYVVVFFFVGLLPSIISVAFPIENPGNLRMGMAMPFVMLTAALALALIARRVRAWVGGQIGVFAGGALATALFGAIAVTNYDQYFNTYRVNFARNSQHTSYVARAVRGFVALGGARDDVKIMIWPHWFDLRLVAAQTGSVRWDPGMPAIDVALQADGVPRPRMYIVHPDDVQSLQRLRRWYPGGLEHAHALWELDGRPWFVTYVVPPNTRAAA